MIFDFENTGNPYFAYIGNGLYRAINAKYTELLYVDLVSYLQLIANFDERRFFRPLRHTYDPERNITLIEIEKGIFGITTDRLHLFREEYHIEQMQQEYNERYNHAKMCLEDINSRLLK